MSSGLAILAVDDEPRALTDIKRLLETSASVERVATAMSGTRVGSGTWASSAWRTIGARTPSTSSRIALCRGSAFRGARSSSNVAAVATDLVCRRFRRADRWPMRALHAPGYACSRRRSAATLRRATGISVSSRMMSTAVPLSWARSSTACLRLTR